MPETTTMPIAESAVAPSAIAAQAIGAVKTYGSGSTTVRALDGVDVAFAAGQFTAVMGPSGSGKSTLMHCLAGLDHLSAGRIIIGDTDLSTMTERELTILRRRAVGFVFQAFNLVPTLTARENIELPLLMARQRCDEAWLNTVVGAVGLGDRLHHTPNELSGGQQQRVAVCRALVSRPEIIFADEPTGNLDSSTGAEILAFMRQAVDSMAHTIVMVTHDAVAASYADEVIFLADGRIVDRLDSPTPSSVLDRIGSLSGREQNHVS